ncbi:hypothetical protein LCGC14_2947830, partial [marine sediment metagenome]
QEVIGPWYSYDIAPDQLGTTFRCWILPQAPRSLKVWQLQAPESLFLKEVEITKPLVWTSFTVKTFTEEEGGLSYLGIGVISIEGAKPGDWITLPEEVSSRVGLALVIGAGIMGGIALLIKGKGR